MKTAVSVQLGGGGVTALTRSAGRRRLSSRRKVRGHLMEAGRSLLLFICGMLLASLYGVMALFLQKQPLWLCVHSTLAIAFMAAFGMGLSVDARANIMVMMPSLCSAQGRSLLLFLSVTLLLAAPLSNTIENMERVAASLLCGAELAANQTQELMQRSATPLLSALKKIKEIKSNAVAVKRRVHNLIHAMTDSIRHVARTLRNVMHFLVDIGDTCNAKLGSPYRKCRAVFTEAQSDCSDLLGEFNFLCDIIQHFLPLCQLARVGELFCVIPSYIARHLKTRLAAPTILAFERMKREFDFNISVTASFDLDANSSRSLHQVTQDIMEEVSSELQLFQKLSEPLAYGSLVLLAFSFLKAWRYRRRYLNEDDFDNVYITAQFEEFDQQVTSGGGASILPLTPKEAETYISPVAWHLTNKEQRAVLGGVVSVLRHTVMGGLLLALDYLVFWMLDQVHHQVKADVVARAPVKMTVQVNGTGYASDIFRDLVASFNILQGGNITVISRKCLMKPSEPDQSACFILGLLLGLALLVSLSGGFMQRCRRLVCSYYHPEREQERIQFLYQLILDHRRAMGKALRRSVPRSAGGEGRSSLYSLMLRLPGGAHLCKLLGLSSVICLACGEGAEPAEDKMVTCDVPRCPGVYCRPCFHSLGSMCVICVRPLTSEEGNSEEELDSTDEEQPEPIAGPSQMRRRISTATRQTSSEHSNSQMRVKEDGGERHSSSEISEAEMTLQDRPGSSESSSDTSFHSAPSPPPGLLEQSLTSVLVHTPDGPQPLQQNPGPCGTLQDPPESSRIPQDPQDLEASLPWEDSQQWELSVAVKLTQSLLAVFLCCLALSCMFEAAQMTKYSDLELAINTLVTEFHKAADDKPTMNTTQFQNMISNQLPAFSKAVESEDGMEKVLQQMGVEAGQNISFNNFWTLINKEAVQLFSATHKEKNAKCTCLLQ